MICKKCALHKGRKNIVNGRGSVDAKILFIGESPSSSEDMLGRGFVSDSATILMDMIRRTEIGIDKCFFINMVLCRPLLEDKKTGREPTSEEVLACIPNVLDQIEKVNYIGAVFIGSLVEKYYKNRIFTPWITLTDMNIVRIKGGAMSNLFLDNFNKLERFYDRLTQ